MVGNPEPNFKQLQSENTEKIPQTLEACLDVWMLQITQMSECLPIEPFFHIWLSKGNPHTWQVNFRLLMELFPGIKLFAL